MDIGDLKLFMRISQLGSISAAARDLNLTPASASARLAAFEKQLGGRLVHRTTRQATLTVDGLAFLPHAENVLDAADAARAALGSEQAAPRGTLRVAAPASFARMHIVPGLPDFRARYPDLMLDFRIYDSVLPEFPLVSKETLWALYPSSRELAPKVRAFVDWMVDRIGPHPYWDRGLEALFGQPADVFGRVRSG